MLSGYDMNSSNRSFLRCPTVMFASQAVTAQLAEVHGWYHPCIYLVLDCLRITANNLVIFVTWTAPSWEARKCS